MVIKIRIVLSIIEGSFLNWHVYSVSWLWWLDRYSFIKTHWIVYLGSVHSLYVNFTENTCVCKTGVTYNASF